MVHLFLYLVYISEVTLSLNQEEFEALVKTHQQFCPSVDPTCANIIEVDHPNVGGDAGGNRGQCCGYCECNDGCVDYGSCCPETFDSYSHASLVIELNRFGCVTPQYITDPEKTDFKGAFKITPVWMITKCNPEISKLIDDRFTRLCKFPGQDGSLKSLVPVTDNTLHYRNIYCSLCNGLSTSDISFWQVEFFCSDVISLTDDYLLDKVAEKKCNIFYKSPESVELEDCGIPAYSISECNETGLWTVYNETIQLACDLFVDPFNLTYKNYFCFLCNTGENSSQHNGVCKTKDDIVDVTPPFTAIFDIGSTNIADDEDALGCDILTQFRDGKMMVCRNILCHDLRHLNGLQCQPKTGPTEATCYQMFIKLTPVRGTVLDITFVRVDFMLMVNKLAEFMFTSNNTLVEVESYTIYINAAEDTELSYVVFEVVLSARLTRQNDILVQLTNRVHRKMFDVLDVTFLTEIAKYNKTVDTDNDNKVLVSTYNNTVYSTSELIQFITFPSGSSDCASKDIYLFSKLHVCPFIQIGLDDWAIKIQNNFLIIEEEFTQKAFSRWEFERKADKINICLEDFKSIFDSLPSKTSKIVADDFVSPKQILAFVFMCLSIASLLVTVAIYLLYAELQSQPGINNIILCICLLLAQSLYQFGAGQRSLSYWECSVIGAFCHFFWLTVMFSMNSCSVQMYLIFKRTLKLSPKFQWGRTVKYALYVALSSLFFVVINVCVSLIKSGGEESGYGGNVCYVSSAVMLLVTFILPAGVTIFANIGLFSYVVFRLQKSNVSSTKMNLDRNYFGVYARLSTLTGLTWLFGFIMLLVQNDVLEYLFIIFNASQGVFIMIAFLINKRVYSIWRSSSLMYSSRKSRLTTASRIDTKDESVTVQDEYSKYNAHVVEDQEKPGTSYEYRNGTIS